MAGDNWRLAEQLAFVETVAARIAAGLPSTGTRAEAESEHAEPPQIAAVATRTSSTARRTTPRPGTAGLFDAA